MSEHTTIWRLVHQAHAETAYTTHEPYKFPGLHTPRNTAVIYAAESSSQVILEALLHLGDPQILDRDYLLVPAKIPSTSIYQAKEFTHDLHQRHLALRLSSNIPGEYLILLNPAHENYQNLKPGKPVSPSKREETNPQEDP